MRNSQLDELMATEFGAAMAGHIRRNHVLSEVAGECTVEEALAAGVPPRQVWHSVCVDFDVPAERQWGPDPGPPAGRVD